METIHFTLLIVAIYILYIIYNKVMLVFTDYDANGINKNGYDKEGFHSKHGFNQDGYNRKGYNRYTRLFRDTGTKFDKEGYNDLGYDENGYTQKGYNKNGYTKNGFNLKGYNKNGYDKNGFNKKGHDKTGYDRYDNDVVYGYPRNLTIDKLVLNPNARYRFYYLKLIHKGKPVYKIGITSTTVYNRYTSHTSESVTYNYQILFDKKADNAEEFELALKLRHNATYLQLLGTEGSEIFDTDILSLDNITECSESKSEKITKIYISDDGGINDFLKSTLNKNSNSSGLPEIDINVDEDEDDFQRYNPDKKSKAKSKTDLTDEGWDCDMPF